MDLAEQVPFHALCHVLDAVQRQPSSNKAAKEKLMEQFIERWRSHQKQLFPLMRLLIPQLDQERQALGLKEHFLAQTFIQLLGLSSQSIDAQSLSKWRDPNYQQTADTTGQFSELIFRLVKERSTVTESAVSIAEVNRQLDKMRDAFQNRSAEVKPRQVQLEVFRYFFEKSTPLEVKWLVDIVLKKLKLGVGQLTLLRSIHPDAPAMLNVCSDLHEICVHLEDINQRHTDLSIELFRPFSAMHLKRVMPEDVPRCMDEKPFWMEPKLDGIRLMMHMNNHEFRYFSRNFIDHTSDFGGTQEQKTSKRIYPLLTGKSGGKIQSLILDGEMMVFDPMTDRFSPFGTIRTVAGSDTGEITNNPRPCFVVFDILYLNGWDMTKFPLEKRRQNLRDLIQEQHGVLQIVEHRIGTNVQDVTSFVEEVMMNRGEGVCIKQPESPYIMGWRGNQWVKVKPDYISELGEHCDVLVVGAYYGRGSRSNAYSSFLCAVKNTRQSGGQWDQDWLSFVKFGSGFSMELMQQLSDRVAAHAKPYDSANPPSWLALPGEKPHAIIEPRHSFIVELKATEFIIGQNTAAPYSLRFPRFVRVREDKSYLDCLTLDGLLAMQKQSVNEPKRLVHGDYSKAPDEAQASGSRPRTAARASPQKKETADFFPKHMQALKEDDIQLHSELFSGMEICILSGTDEVNCDKQSLEKLVVAHGGSITQNPMPTTRLVVVGKHSAKSKNLSENVKKWDLINVDWLKDCTRQNLCIPLIPKYVIFATEETNKKMLKTVDPYGDFYSMIATPESIRDVFDHIKLDAMDECISNEPKASHDFIKLIEEENDMYPSSFGGIFRQFTFFMDRYLPDEIEIENSPLELIEKVVQFYGGAICTSSQSASHIVVNPDDLTRLNTFHSLRPRPRIVSMKWVNDCVKERTILPEEEYSVW